MDPTPPDRNVGYSASQAFESPASSGETSSGAARRRQHKPVTSECLPRELQTSDRAPKSISGPASPQSTIPQPHPPMLLLEIREPTEQDLFHDAYCLIEQCLDPGGQEISQCFLHGSEQPPVTPESLSELDMPRIINNPKLRYDVNFDRDLHFRPNLEGTKGRQKVRLAEEYWKALEGELFLVGLVQRQRRDLQQAENEAYWVGVVSASQVRLPKLFHAIRDILKTLVPDNDQKSICERLDVDLIMQEIKNGVCDLIDLGNWLAKVLKNHCAPMRDHMVDSMRIEITAGAKEEKPGRLVNGIRQLLNILEAMKLDVANHQIRHMRPLLVEDTVNFSRRYNAHRIAIGKINVPDARGWLGIELNGMLNATEGESNELYGTDRPNFLKALTSALLKGIIFNESTALFPQTFYLDTDRLRALRTELHTSIYKSICGEILNDMLGSQAVAVERVKATAMFERSIQALLGSYAGRLDDRLDNIAVEIMRVILTAENRYPQFDPELLDMVQQRVFTDLQSNSPPFEKHAEETCNKLLPKLHKGVAQHFRLTALHLQDMLVPPVALPVQPFGFGAVCAPSSTMPNADADDDIIRRFTHIIVLHWQIWADLVYALPDYDEDTLSSGSGRGSPCPGAESPMVPVAQAVYAPGRKWLPIGVTVAEVPLGIPTPSPTPPPSDPQARTGNTEQTNDTAEHSATTSGPNNEHQRWG